jgi:hypothetical protein
MMISLYVYNPDPFHRVLSRVVSYIRHFRKPQYSDIPDSTLPSFDMIGNSVATAEGLILGGGGDSNHHRRSSSSSYQLGMWKRSTNTFKRWLAMKGWYQPKNRKLRKYEQKKTG